MPGGDRRRVECKEEKPRIGDLGFSLSVKGRARFSGKVSIVEFVLYKDWSITSEQYGLERGKAECQALMETH